MAKRKKGSGSFASKFLGPGDSSHPRKPANHGRDYMLGAAGKKRRKGSAIVPGGVKRKGK